MTLLNIVMLYPKFDFLCLTVFQLFSLLSHHNGGVKTKVLHAREVPINVDTITLNVKVTLIIKLGGSLLRSKPNERSKHVE